MKMHFKYIFGLILIFLVTKSHSRATEATIFYEDDEPPNSLEDDYYSEEEIETSTILNQNLTTTTVLPTTINVTSVKMSIVAAVPTSASKIIDIPIELPKLKPKCPESCDCKNDFQFVNCSNENLTNVPNDIPETVLILDLSNNLIEELQSDSFDNSIYIKELILTGNQIKTISEEAFSKLQNLTHVMLDGNLLTSIHSDTFLNAQQLKMLNLNNNTIEIPVNSPFLNQDNLNELHLANNNLTEIYDETFNYLTGLKVLRMDSNNFNQKINIKAFKPLKQLSKLKLPNLEEDTIRELCEIITSIDVVNFEKFDISCFELSSGQKFDESIITVNPNIMNQQNVVEEPNNNNNTSHESGMEKEMITTSKETKSTGSLIVLGTTTQAAAGSSLTSTLMNSESSRFNESLSHTEGSYISNKIQDNGDESEKTYQVAISTQTINNILLAIIIVAVVGLLIGVVCRKDICGIKTKLCRTKRPPPTDQVRPAEEVPLNKIV